MREINEKDEKDKGREMQMEVKKKVHKKEKISICCLSVQFSNKCNTYVQRESTVKNYERLCEMKWS